MPKIKLLDPIHPELRILGLKHGYIVPDCMINPTTGSAYFRVQYNGFNVNSLVAKNCYEIIPEPELPVNICHAIPSEITLQINTVVNTLDAMYWCFSPYLNDDFENKPWIKNLIKSFNNLVVVLPDPWQLQYKPINLK